MAGFYLPPGGIDDFGDRETAEAFRQKWHDYIANGDPIDPLNPDDPNRFIGIAGRAAEGGLFYDAQDEPVPAGTSVPVPWNGFPRSILQWFNVDSDPSGLQRALATADVLRPRARVRRSDTNTPVLIQYRQQDEYCEWYADRDTSGRITRISFTAEGPEYWEKLAEADRGLLLELYRKHISPAVQEEDLFWPADMLNQDGKVVFERNTYNRWNKWNTFLGAMHLTHPANTLGAEINLAADATVLFPAVPEAPASTLPTRLICCAGYGGVNRSSDPLIGAGVNGLARGGSSVTLANPVGLYISEVGIDGLRDPDGQSIGAQSLKVVRSSVDGSMKLRVEITPPLGASFTLDQCTFDGAPLRHGGQIARRITMILFGLTKLIPGRQALASDCLTRCCSNPAAPNFRASVAPSTQCSSITQEGWNRYAPLETAITAAADEEIELPAGGVEVVKSYSRTAI